MGFENACVWNGFDHLLFQQLSYSVNINLAIMRNLFLYCFLGKLATESFIQMSDFVHQCNWLDLPIDLKKYFIRMMENTQRPLYHEYGIAVLNLETFLKVSKWYHNAHFIFCIYIQSSFLWRKKEFVINSNINVLIAFQWTVSQKGLHLFHALQDHNRRLSR